MHRNPFIPLSLVAASMLFGCTTGPPDRLEAYLGPEAEPAAPDSRSLRPDGYRAGLVLINDTSAEASAPALSTETLDKLASRVQEQIEHNFSITIEEVVKNPDIAPQGSAKPFLRLAEHHGWPHILLAIMSSTESEVPTYLPMGGIFQGGGGGRASSPGYNARNYARVDLALLDQSGQVLITTKGEAYAELYRLNVPVESNVYPVVTRSQVFTPIYPEEGHAHDAMRGVAASDALQQALMHFKMAWLEREHEMSATF